MSADRAEGMSADRAEGMSADRAEGNSPPRAAEAALPRRTPARPGAAPPGRDDVYPGPGRPGATGRPPLPGPRPVPGQPQLTRQRSVPDPSRLPDPPQLPDPPRPAPEPPLAEPLAGPAEVAMALADPPVGADVDDRPVVVPDEVTIDLRTHQAVPIVEVRAEPEPALDVELDDLEGISEEQAAAQVSVARRRLRLGRRKRVRRRSGRRAIRDEVLLDEPLPFDAPLDPRRVAPAWGWRRPGGGRASHVTVAAEYQGTTSQVCGLFPFVAGSGAPHIGVPIGRHMHWGQVVSLEPFAWLASGLVTNPGIFVLGQPGVGKSSIGKRLMTGMVAYGIHPLVLGDVKPDYARLVRKLDGQVVRVGRGLDRINPLDSGPLGQAIGRMDAAGHHDMVQILLAELRGRRLALLAALCALGRGHRPVTPGEEVMLGAALDHLVAELPAGTDPTVIDVLDVVREAPDDVVAAAEVQSEAEFHADSKFLRQTLRLLIDGSLRGMFDGPTSNPIDLDAPAIDIDLSAVANGAEDTAVAASMLCTWAYGFGVVDASLALAEVGLAPSRNYIAFMDELWRALRGAPGLVDRADTLTRVNRQKGMAQIMMTHSLADLEALPTEEDRAKAKGFVERCAVTILGGLPPRELDAVAEVVGQLSIEERRMVSSWSTPTSWSGGEAHPGRGKYLIKAGMRAGIPVEMEYVADEAQLYDTDAAAVANAGGRVGPLGLDPSGGFGS